MGDNPFLSNISKTSASYQADLTFYEEQMQVWRDNDQLARLALTLLREATEPFVWKEFSEVFGGSSINT